MSLIDLNTPALRRHLAAISIGGTLTLASMGAAAAPSATDIPPAACDGPYATVLHASAAIDARAYWLNRQLIKWPGADAGARFKLAGALDDIYASAAKATDLGATVGKAGTQFKLWAPTAQRVAVCTYASGDAKAGAIAAMRFDADTGIWSATQGANLSGSYYKFVVDVVAPNAGLVRNLVTDPYSVSLSTDSKRSYIADLDAAALKPPGWDASSAPRKVAAQTDMTVYELHVRDFSINDASVSAPHRGKYAAFSEPQSNGMRHLAALSRAGITDIHLLPVFDFASVPEHGCVTPTPSPSAAPDSEAQQALIHATQAGDCCNWGYDPYHFGAPEGSYATDAADGARRIIEFRQMVEALHGIGLRVGMDVVYNHTMTAGQNEQSDRKSVV